MRKFFTKKVMPINYRSKNIVIGNSIPSKNKLDFSWTTLVSIILTGFTAIAFGSGQAYRNAYLEPFNLDVFQIPKSFQDTIYIGIVKQVGIITLSPLLALLILILIIGVMSLSFSIKDLFISKKAKAPKPNKINSYSKFELEHPALIIFLDFLAKFFAFGFLLMMLSLFFVAALEKMGAKDAINDKNAMLNLPKIENNKAKKELRLVEIHRIIEGKDVKEMGYLIDSNEHTIAIYAPGLKRNSSRIVYLDNLVSFNITKPFQN